MALDKAVLIFNTITMVAISLASIWVVLDSRFKLGAFLAAGLSMVCLGALSVAWWSVGGVIPEEFPDITRSIAVLNIGFIIVIWGLFRRVFCSKAAKCPRRRTGDIFELKKSQQVHVFGGKKS